MFAKTANSNNPSTGSSLTAAGAGAALLSNSGTNAFCPQSDQSFYCQMYRTLGIVQMTIAFIVIFLSVLYLLYFLYTNRKTFFYSSKK